MLEIVTKKYIFKKKNIWFSDYPFDVTDCDALFFFACRNKVPLSGFICEEAPTLIIDLNNDLDTIWKNVSERVRRYIKRAKKEGVEIRVNQNFDEFKDLYFRFANQKGFKTSTGPLEMIKPYGTLFTTHYKGELIAGMLTIEDTDITRELVRASRRLDVGHEMEGILNGGNKLMVWEAIAHAKEKGRKIYDFGGYYPTTDKNDPRYSIKIFKERFGGTPVTYYKYSKYYSKIYKLIKYLLSKVK
jgi:lipid II:glycine glycyltransferase (peptidoglycan interpeptide bridge formation enzyme)